MLIWAARAAASGRLKRNMLVGIRTTATMASDSAWLAAHGRSKTPTTLAGVAALASSLFMMLPVAMWVFVTAVLVGCAAMLGFVSYGAWVGTRAAAALNDSEV